MLILNSCREEKETLTGLVPAVRLLVPHCIVVCNVLVSKPLTEAADLEVAAEDDQHKHSFPSVSLAVDELKTIPGIFQLSPAELLQNVKFSVCWHTEKSKKMNNTYIMIPILHFETVGNIHDGQRKIVGRQNLRQLGHVTFYNPVGQFLVLVDDRVKHLLFDLGQDGVVNPVDEGHWVGPLLQLVEQGVEFGDLFLRGPEVKPKVKFQ